MDCMKSGEKGKFAVTMLTCWQKLFRLNRQQTPVESDGDAVSAADNKPATPHTKLSSSIIPEKTNGSTPKPTSLLPVKHTHKSGKEVSSTVKASEPSSQRTTLVRTRRLMKEYRDLIRRSQSKESIFNVSLVDENICEWIVELHTIDVESRLYKEMKQKNVTHIELRISFPENFPFSPPFMFVSSPRIENGYVLDGGAICMELLTPKGWASGYTVESIILQFAASLVRGGGRLAGGKKKNKFSKKSAKSTFHRLVETHEKYGWVSPPKQQG